jgi:hypothetical protein
MRKIMRMGAIAALAIAGLVGSGGSASADSTATINIHARYCPPGAVDVFADCHDNPIVGLEVGLYNHEDYLGYEATDEDGNASFIVAGSDDYGWTYEGGPQYPEDFVTSYCSVEGGDGSDIEIADESDDADEDWYFFVADGDVVTCDVYFWNWDMDPIHGGAETPNTGAGPMTTGTSAGFFLAGAVALGGLAVASRKRAFR